MSESVGPLPRVDRSNARAALSCAAVVAVAIGIVVAVDAILEARVRAGLDNGLRLSVLLPYIGVGSRYVLARSCGIAALVLSGVSVALGLEMGRRRIRRRRSTGLARLHRQVSLAALALVVAHVVLPYTSSVAPFDGWPTSLVPFGQPYSFGVRGKVFESFGILAAYALVLLGPTYYLLRRRRWAWSALHSLTVAAYALAVLHALFLGSDFVVSGPTRVALVAVQIPLTVLVARRLFAEPRTAAQRAGAFAAVLLSAVVVGFAIAGCAGASLGGLQI